MDCSLVIMECSLLSIHVRKIQSYTADKNLWIHFFQDSLSGTQLEWFYKLEVANIRSWEDLAAAFYRQYQYNADLTPMRPSSRVCLWERAKVSKIMLRNGGISLEECNHP